MTRVRTSASTASDTTARDTAASAAFRLVAAVLALAVTVIHVEDQGGLTALKDPAYVGYGYWLLEIAGVLCAVLLLARRAPGWLLAAGVAAGPLLGYVLSRGPGLPGYTDDKGNWTEPIGIISLVVEGLLLLLALSHLPARRAH